MKCVICKHGELQPGTATFMAEKQGRILIVKGVPALVCANCKEAYYEGPVMEDLLCQAKESATTETEVDVRHYAAA